MLKWIVIIAAILIFGTFFIKVLIAIGFLKWLF